MKRSIHPAGRRRPVALELVALLTVALAGAPSAARAADDYLSAINEEGDRLESLGRAREERARLERDAGEPRAAKPDATDQAAFERELNAQFPASFALYSMLNADERTQVYAEYRQAHARGAARFFPVLNRIIALSTQKR